MDKIYNDNELLYMISENDENAFELLCEKYHPLITTRLIKFKISSNYDDFYQECLMVLHKCVVSYREDKNKTFNKYLDMSIQYRIRNLLRGDKNYFYNVIFTDSNIIDRFSKTNLDENKSGIINRKINISKLSDFEKEVYKNINAGKNIKEISFNLSKDIRAVYNALSRLNKKSATEKIIKNKKSIKDNIFSPLEQNVYELKQKGLKSSEIADRLNCSCDVVYNALKRVKNKTKILIDK